jgi:hypothetical protein
MPQRVLVRYHYPRDGSLDYCVEHEPRCTGVSEHIARLLDADAEYGEWLRQQREETYRLIDEALR